ncbi:MAG: protease modulator HflC [Gammaproteobacteria bacterium]|nr:protease modulator HflC [Gammaproteobacteria bacterium]MDH5660416.1 protease modulator HflC [Gammaproteobacteria bacterium]
MVDIKTSGLIAAVVILVGGLMSIFVVDERELVLKFRLGEIVKSDYEAGIYFKIPLVNNIKKFDKRILTLDARPAIYLTKEKKNVNVDFFVKWRIANVETFYKSMSGGNERIAAERLYTVVNDGLRDQFSKRTIKEVIAGEREEIMNESTKAANEQVGKFGIELVDVRVKRIDFSEDISNSVYRRMEAERTRVAKDYRSRGAEAAERIRADADRQRTVTIADAYREAEKTRGDGDGKAANIYAKAYTKDSEFYSFYRSLNAYKESFNAQSDIMVIDPSSDFFKYFKKSKK